MCSGSLATESIRCSPAAISSWGSFQIYSSHMQVRELMNKCFLVLVCFLLLCESLLVACAVSTEGVGGAE